MRKIAVSEWVYLAISIAASWWLIEQQKDESHLEIRVLWNGIKVCRWVQDRVHVLEHRLSDRVDMLLEEGRSV